MPIEKAPTRVLVVDDDAVVSDTLAIILRGQGFDARAVYSGEDAAKVALEWEPYAVISDVDGSDGWRGPGDLSGADATAVQGAPDVGMFGDGATAERLQGPRLRFSDSSQALSP